MTGEPYLKSLRWKEMGMMMHRASRRVSRYVVTWDNTSTLLRPMAGVRLTELRSQGPHSKPSSLRIHGAGATE